MNRAKYLAHGVTGNFSVRSIPWVGKDSLGSHVTKARQQREYIEILHDRYSKLRLIEIPMFPHEIKGMDKLKDIEKNLFE